MSRGLDLRAMGAVAATRKRALGLAAGVMAATAVAAGFATASSTRAGTPLTVPITVSSARVGPAIAPGFVGIATEFWNVEQEVGTDPKKPDTAFEQIARNLSPYGGLSLRIGGDSTDWTWFPIPGMRTPPWVRWTMTPTWAAVTGRLVSDLHAHLIIGLNMEALNPKITEAEYREILTGIGGSAPITYELGNEPELYNHFPYYHANGAAVLGRPKTYTLAQMPTQWGQLADALPQLRFAGPGYAGLNALPYVNQFLAQTKQRLSLLTVHTYPLKSTRCDPGAHLQEGDLFSSQSLAELATGVRAWSTLAHHYGVGIRVDEMNSVTCGGQRGITPTFGPALWALNILPLYAADGINGVNFQTRPFTAQNLIQTNSTSNGWRVIVQPEYYGLLTFARLTPPGSRLLRVSQPGNGLLTWAVRTPQGQTHVVVTNVGSAAVTVAIRIRHARTTATVEALDATGGLSATGRVTLGGQSIDPSTGALTGRLLTTPVRPEAGAYHVRVPSASAEILTF